MDFKEYLVDMKSNLLILKIIFSFSLFSNINIALSQWVQQTSGVTTSVYDIYFLNTQTGWACVANGVILKTTNSGVNWTQHTSGISQELRSIFFINANTGWTVSRVVGYILKTTNSGVNWVQMYGTPLRSFNNVFALDSLRAWVTGVGINGYIYKTTDGGNSWDSVVNNTGSGYDVIFFNSSTGIATFGSNIHRSTDGGNSWILAHTGIGELVELTFAGNTGYAVSTSYRIRKTIDQGVTWNEITQISGDGNCHSIFFANMNTGWISGDVDNMYKTTDGGFNWIRQNTQSGVFLSSVFFATDSIGWTCGALGKIFYTSTSGAYVSIENQGEIIPSSFELKQNYPNPFNPVTDIKFALPQNTYVTVKVFNAIGEEIAILINNEWKTTGKYSIRFDGTNLASGIYFYLIKAGSFSETKKMVLLK